MVSRRRDQTQRGSQRRHHQRAHLVSPLMVIAMSPPTVDAPSLMASRRNEAEVFEKQLLLMGERSGDNGEETRDGSGNGAE